MSARGCSSRSTTMSGLPRLPGHGHRHQFVGETTRLVRGDRAVMGPHGQFVLLLAGNPVLGAAGSRRSRSCRRRWDAKHRPLFRGHGRGDPAVRCRLDARRCEGRARSARRWTSTPRRRPPPPWPHRWRPDPRRRAPPAVRSRTVDRSAGRAHRCRVRRRVRRCGRWRVLHRLRNRCPGRRRRRRPRRGRSARRARAVWLWRGRWLSAWTSAPPIRPTGVRSGLQITTSMPRP